MQNFIHVEVNMHGFVSLSGSCINNSLFENRLKSLIINNRESQ